MSYKLTISVSGLVLFQADGFDIVNMLTKLQLCLIFTVPCKKDHQLLLDCYAVNVYGFSAPSKLEGLLLESQEIAPDNL